MIFIDESRPSPETVDKAKRSKVEVKFVKLELLEKFSSTKTTSGVIALVETKPECDFSSVELSDLVFVLCGINDPGNLGTCLRSLRAMGVESVMLLGNCVDLWSPKVVRAGEGSHWGMNIVEIKNDFESLKLLKQAKFRTIGALPKGGVEPSKADLTGKIAIFMGSESHGLNGDLQNQLDEFVTIQIHRAVESLNVAAATAILGYEANRQRNTRSF